MKSLWIVLSILLWTGIATAAEVAVEAITAKFEASMEAQLQKATMPRQRLELEYMQRQSYALYLVEEVRRALRSGKLTTPEVEDLRAKRKALIQQVQELDKAIEEASRKAPLILEFQDVMKANEERISEIREALMKDSQSPVQPAAPNP